MGVIYTKINAATVAACQAYAVAGIVAAGDTGAVPAELARIARHRAVTAMIPVYIQVRALVTAAGLPCPAIRPRPPTTASPRYALLAVIAGAAGLPADRVRAADQAGAVLLTSALALPPPAAVVQALLEAGGPAGAGAIDLAAWFACFTRRTACLENEDPETKRGKTHQLSIHHEIPCNMVSLA